MPHCHNCDTSIDTTDDLEADTLDVIETEDGDGGSPQIHIGTEVSDVWRCKGCGSVYGSRKKHS